MERTEFVAADGQSWWLYEVHTEIRIEEARRELGLALGWTENEWFVDPYRREALFDFLQANGPRLLVDLDTVAYDEDRLRWVVRVQNLAAPAQQGADKDQPAEAAKLSPAPEPVERKAAPAAAPAKKSAFTAKAGSDAAAATKSDADTALAGGTPVTARLEEATKAVLSDLGGGGLADLAQELGVEAADLQAIVNEPDFERQVRDEVARLVDARG